MALGSFLHTKERGELLPPDRCPSEGAMRGAVMQCPCYDFGGSDAERVGLFGARWATQQTLLVKFAFRGRGVLYPRQNVWLHVWLSVNASLQSAIVLPTTTYYYQVLLPTTLSTTTSATATCMCWTASPFDM